jgi:hypothetical protein
MENKNLIAALVKAQAEIKPPAKEGVNPMFKNKYATLDAIYHSCRKALANNGLVLSHSVEEENGRYTLVTTLHHVSGEMLQNKFPMLVEKNTNQGIASARTYACRYATCNLLALPGDEDDDGNASALSSAQQKEIEGLIDGDNDLADKILRGYRVKSLSEIESKNFVPIVKNLQKRRQVPA